MRTFVVCLGVVTGCWHEQRVDDVFSEAEWDYLQTYRKDRLPSITCNDDACVALARFGQRLFFDPGYSGKIKVASDAGQVDESGKIACSRCHDPSAFFVDGRAPNAQSLGTDWTGRNVPGLVDVGFRQSFTWSGKYQAIGEVFDLALTSPAALNTTIEKFASFMRDHYAVTYDSLFPGMWQCDQVFKNAAVAIGAYEMQLVSGPSPFDAYLAGDTTAIDASAKRGAQLFIGKALCSECHAGPLFTDEQFHVTGIEQRGEHAPPVDPGRMRWSMIASDEGKFRTPTLRHVAKTGPYMHAGQLETLGEVIDFYRWGGHPTGFVGVKDPRIVPLEIDDDDAHDLEAFLLTLTGPPIAGEWVVDWTKPVKP